jgi:hypothetical protein
MLIKFLIIFFSLLIIYQIYIYLRVSREGLENTEDGYQPYSESTSVLTEKNTANIEILKKEIDKCKDLKTTVTDLSSQVQNIQNQMNSFSDQNVSPSFNPDEASKVDDKDIDKSLEVMG